MSGGETVSSFDFGDHTRGDAIHGLVVASNHETYRPGGGCRWHPHRDVEMVFVVLQGRLRHRDSLGNDDVFVAGDAFHLSAGTGVWHAHENSDSATHVSFVQTWVLPHRAGGEPRHGAARQAFGRERMTLLAAGSDGLLRIGQPHARLFAMVAAPGETFSISLPDHGHVYVAEGRVDVSEVALLSKGDALRCRNAGSLDVAVGGDADALLLAWATSGSPPGW